MQESPLITLVVTPCASTADTDITNITATLSCPAGDSAAIEIPQAGNITTTVKEGVVANIEPNNAKYISSPGLVNFEHTVSNIGNLDATFNFVTDSVRGWKVQITPTTRTLESCESTEIHLTVTVPYTWNLSDTIVITAGTDNTLLFEPAVAFDWIRDGRIYLPLLMRNYCLCYNSVENGDFETGDFTGWEHNGGLSQDVVCSSPLTDCSALLGDPTYNCEDGVPPNAAAWMQQSIQIPSCGSPQLSFHYEIHTQDVLEADKYDSFDVYLGGHLVLRAGDTESNYSSCAGQANIIIGDHAIDLANPTDYAGNLINTNFLGNTVTLRFENWSRYDSWYNTWTYVDDVKLTCLE